MNVNIFITLVQHMILDLIWTTFICFLTQVLDGHRFHVCKVNIKGTADS